MKRDSLQLLLINQGQITGHGRRFKLYIPKVVKIHVRENYILMDGRFWSAATATDSTKSGKQNLCIGASRFIFMGFALIIFFLFFFGAGGMCSSCIIVNMNCMNDILKPRNANGNFLLCHAHIHFMLCYKILYCKDCIRRDWNRVKAFKVFQ